MNKWDIVFHKEYSYDKNVLDLLIDIYLEVIDKNFVSKDDFDLDEYMPHLIKDSSNLGKIIKNSNDIIENNSILIPLIEYLVKFVYQYNFLILKNEQYKKIVVAFPGITTYFQIIEELIHEGMIELKLKSNNKLFLCYGNVLQYFQ